MARGLRAEDIIKAASGPYHLLVGNVYDWNKPVPMMRASQAGKVSRPAPRKRAPKKAVVKGRGLSKAEFLRRMAEGKAKARSRRGYSDDYSYQGIETE